jgi:hypothetical protein
MHITTKTAAAESRQRVGFGRPRHWRAVDPSTHPVKFLVHKDDRPPGRRRRTKFTVVVIRSRRASKAVPHAAVHTT